MKKKRLVCKAIEYILKKNPKELSSLTVKEIASGLNVSAPHLSRSFKDEMGINLKKFIVREKILAVRFFLIQNRKISIKDVSSYFDFCSCDYFINLFKEYTGMTPGQFRKMYKGFYGLRDRRKGLSDRRSSDTKVIMERRSYRNDRRNS